VTFTASSWQDGITNLRQAVQSAGYRLDEAAYDCLCALFQWFAAELPTPEQMRCITPEYGSDEFLSCVDPAGQAARVPAAVLDDYDRIRGRQPQYALWLRPVEGPEGRALLIARWLCHLVGFRHRTVHLMLDHPTLPDHVLAQVRGVYKAESPGCFDLPVAGHVSGLSTVETTLRSECEEELGLAQDQIVGLRRVGSYDRSYLESLPGFWNVEQHAVFRGRLSEAAWSYVHAPHDEVAGIAFFPVARLRALIARFPDRVASGLRDALPLYT